MNNMDYETFSSKVAERFGHDASDVDALVEGLALVLAHSCSDLDSVAVPTFGTFAPRKHPEEVVDDMATGKKMLVPPEITVEFRPGAMLTKRIR